jgi:ABC-type branched-subunit amino acid transport system ATPase component
MSLLDVTDLVTGYGKTAILHGVSARVDEGEIVAVFGPNGAGKSTLVKAVCGQLPVSAGAVRFRGQSIAGVPPDQLARRGLGCVPQEGNTFAALTVEENLLVAQSALPRGRRGAGIESTYQIFPVLKERRWQRAGTLSGGERQMLALAGAMMMAPSLLILDEPTSGLAPIIVEGLIARTIDFARAGTTVLWIVGDSAERILPHCSRAYLLQSGVVQGEWTVGSLPESESIVDLYFRGHGPGTAPRLPQDASAGSGPGGSLP